MTDDNRGLPMKRNDDDEEDDDDGDFYVHPTL